MKPSEDNIELGKKVATAIGWEPKSHLYYDEEEKCHVHILNCKDPLNKYVKFYWTVGTSDAVNTIAMKDGSTKNIPVELILAGNNSTDKWENILSTTAFYIIKNGWTVQPGSVFKHMVSEYIPNTKLPHVLFNPPIAWKDKLGKPIQLSNKTVHFLMLIPISEAELEYRNKNGYNALEKLFIENAIEYDDINRPSVV